MGDGEDNFEGSKYISNSEKIDDSYHVRVAINLYASNEISKIFDENHTKISFHMRSLIYIKKHLKVY